MKFKQGSRRPAIEYEKDLVKYWKTNQTFEKSVDNRPTTDAYVFYDGPPFITGVPHHGTLISSIIKDAVPRYWTMKGKRVERVWGWDCHGLPAEVFTEKKLGITDKRDIGTKVSLEEYINTCRENMVLTGNEWEDTIDRIGRWVDFKGAYKTMDKDYMESVWWAFKQLYEAGKIYEGEKVLLYCPRDATPISKAEVAMDNSYQDVTDPSVYVKFKLKDDDSYLLVWTTTPWTLSANAALAVGKNINYAKVKIGGDVLIVAKDRLESVLTDEKHQLLDYELLDEFKGKELIGKNYKALSVAASQTDGLIWGADFVNTDEGTGVVHIAPAYGEDDYELHRQHDEISLLMTTNEEGEYLDGEWKGQQVWAVNKQIAKSLHERGDVWKIDYIRHSYPHCHRCGTKLIYRAHPSWFMDIAGQREAMLEQNSSVNWFPDHIKQGRFAKTVESAPDWNLSRDRFWATAMPVWKGVDKQGKEHIKVIGSYSELQQLSGVELEDYHRPWVDDVTFELEGVKYQRIDKVLDCWFESGSMPFAQFHYPFENTNKFEQSFPGDFIAEYVGQVRAWFYYLHAVSVGLFGKNSFKNVVVTGTLAGNDGRKMSKSFGNFTDPNELMDRYSADSLRFLLLSSPVLNGEDFSLQDKDVGDVARKLSMIWNMYDFFTLYADVDGWEWQGNGDGAGAGDGGSADDVGGLPADPTDSLSNPLDLWIISRLHQLNQEVDEHMQNYDLPNALKPILPFVDDASNWYVRRSRKRFWKSDNDSDKNDAYRTLHYVLVQLSLILAPFTPFLAEELYRKLTGGESVHLLDWQPAGHVNELLIEDMNDLREAITLALAERAQASLKVRQPLASLNFAPRRPLAVEYLDFFTSVLAEEVNVKQVDIKNPSKNGQIKVELDLKLTPQLRQEGLMREVIRHIQQVRKQAGLQVDDRISLRLDSGAAEIQKLLKQTELVDLIKAETLTVSLVNLSEPAAPAASDKPATSAEPAGGFSASVKIDGEALLITLAKSK